MSTATKANPKSWQKILTARRYEASVVLRKNVDGIDDVTKFLVSKSQMQILDLFHKRMVYISGAPLLRKRFLSRSVSTYIPGISTLALFEMPHEMEVNDFLMRVRPFFYRMDDIHWEKLCDVIDNIIVNRDPYYDTLRSELREAFDGTAYNRAINSANDVYRKLNTPGEIVPLESEGGSWLSMIESESPIYFDQLKAWLYGHKYHVSGGAYAEWKRLERTVDEVVVVRSARIFYWQVLGCIMKVYHIVGAIRGSILLQLRQDMVNGVYSNAIRKN